MENKNNSILPTTPLQLITRALAYVGLAALAVILGMRIGQLHLDGDILWHLMDARLILHHGIIHTPPATWTAHGHHFVDPEWGWEYILGWVARILGQGAGARILSMILIAVTIALILVQLIRYSVRYQRMLGSIFAFMSLLIFTRLRPQDAGYMLFVLCLILLQLARTHRWPLYVLVVSIAVWENLHGTFLIGVALISFECAWAIVRNRIQAARPKQALPSAISVSKAIWLWSVTILVALFANPYGPALLISQVRAALWGPMRLIAEWAPFSTSSLVILAIVLAAAVSSVLALRHSVYQDTGYWVWALTGLLGILVGLSSAVILPYGLLASGLAVLGLPRLEAGDSVQWHLKHKALRSYWLAVMLGIASLALGTIIGWGPYQSTQDIQLTQAAQHLPAKSTHVFTTYRLGDWIVSTGRPAVIYGDTFIWVGSSMLQRYVAVSNLTANPIPALKSWGTSWVLWPRHKALEMYLKAKGWRVTWEDKAFVILKAPIKGTSNHDSHNISTAYFAKSA